LINGACLKKICAETPACLTFATEKNSRRERNRSLLYFTYMSIEKKTTVIRGLAEEMIAGEPTHFLVDVKLKPGNSIQVLLDADEGLALNKCVSYNRLLYKTLEEMALFAPGDFALEVSSPGLDEPLKMPRQYQKNIGRAVEVVLKDGRKVTGKLLAVEPEILVEETKARLSSKNKIREGGQGKGKKQEIVQHRFSLDQIKTTKVQIVF
jgi:ribosome maturation factor RimP